MIDSPKINFFGGDWLAMKQYCGEKLAELSQRLEDPKTDFDTTQSLRGQAQAFRLILSLETMAAIDAAYEEHIEE